MANLQGISWTEITLTGQANHAGTTPMSMRRDAGYGAARLMTAVRDIVSEIGAGQVGTCGEIALTDNLINVVARQARVAVDLRNSDEQTLCLAEARLEQRVGDIARDEGLHLDTRRLARFEPVRFDPAIVSLISRQSQQRGARCKTMTSGAGHDAQMLARICPTSMIFTPSIGGVSHNPAEASSDVDLETGANILLDVLLELSA